MRAIAMSLTIVVALSAAVATDQASAQNRRTRFRVDTNIPDEDADAADPTRRAGRRLTEAPTGFDNETNGFLPQGPDFDTIDEDNVEPGSFNDNRFIFEEEETIEDGLGPVYNAQGCSECHQNVVTGGASQIAEHRTGRLDGDEFFESLGGSLVHSRATDPEIVELVLFEDTIRTFRISTNTLGAGFIEAAPNKLLLQIRDNQPAAMRGSIVLAPVLEAKEGTTRVGRFGWKSQHASLKSFSGDAYLNEMGITSPLFPEENTSSGMDVAKYDPVEDPEDEGEDVDAFADFMRSTKAPSRGPIDADVLAGETLFKSIGCNVCHVDTMYTSAPGTRINGGELRVPDALGNKIFHPYSDFLLHDIGTGDGIPVQPTPEFASTDNQIRTAPLWALRTRNRLMHDGLTFTEQEAIQRHDGQAASVKAKFNALSAAEKQLVLKFLDSL